MDLMPDTVIAHVLWDAYRGHMHRLYENQQKLAAARAELASLESIIADHQIAAKEIASHADDLGINVEGEWARRYSDAEKNVAQMAFLK